MKNLSLNELVKIERMNILSLNALKQMAIARNIKNYDGMSKEDFLIALIKSNENYTELLKSEDNSNTEIGETKKLFSKLRSNFSLEEIKKCREKFHKKELVYNQLKETDSLTKKEEKMLKNIVKYFKKQKEELSKIKIYQYNSAANNSWSIVNDRQ